MYPRTYEFVQPSSYSYAPQNFPGALHYTYGYSQPRCTNYSTPLQSQVPSGLRCPPPPLSHLTEHLSEHRRGQTEDRPSCMLQEAWRSNLSCSRTEGEQLDQENHDAESVEDGVTGNCCD